MKKDGVAVRHEKVELPLPPVSSQQIEAAKAAETAKAAVPPTTASKEAKQAEARKADEAAKTAAMAAAIAKKFPAIGFAWVVRLDRRLHGLKIGSSLGLKEPSAVAIGAGFVDFKASGTRAGPCSSLGVRLDASRRDEKSAI